MITAIENNKEVIAHTELLQIIRIDIAGAGRSVSFEVQSLTEMKDVIGIALINPNPLSAGHGTIRLRIGDEEILPNGFHADLISKFSHNEVSTKVNFGFVNYLFPVKVRANANPVKIEYAEPSDGGIGKLHLYLLGTKTSSNLNLPKLRFQILDIDISQGDYSNDVEIDIKEKTILNHDRIKGVFLLGISNRVKNFRLCIDENSIFPEGFQAQLITKELVTNSIINGVSGIYTRHICPVKDIIYPTDQIAKNSKIEGKIWAIPNPLAAGKVYLYLIASL